LCVSLLRRSPALLGEGFDGELAFGTQRDAGQQADHGLGDRADLGGVVGPACAGGLDRLGRDLADGGGDIGSRLPLFLRCLGH
jgi:hypothetical protein